MRGLGQISSNIESATRVREFCSLARCIMLAKEGQSARAQIAREARLSPRIVSILSGVPVYSQVNHEIVRVQRAASAAGTTTDSTWGAPLADYQVLASAFLESLRAFGCFDTMLPSMRRVPFRTRIGASTVGISGTTVSEASAKPISRLTLSGTQIDELKCVAVLVMTEELARFSASVAGDLFVRELSNAVAVETDTRFISELTTGVTAITSSGATAENVRHDLRVLLAAITTNARSALYLLMPPAIAKILAVLHTTTGDAAFPDLTFNGGTIGGMQVVVSDGVSSGNIVLVDAQQIAAASDTIEIASSGQALLQLDSTPDSPISASTPFTSLWQTNQVALRAERFIGVEKLTTTGVAVLTNVAYTGDSPGP